MIYLTSWNNGKTARELSRRLSPLNGRLLRPEGSRLQRLATHPRHLVINLGNSKMKHDVSGNHLTALSATETFRSSLLNKPDAVKNAQNKLLTFQCLEASQDTLIPEHYVTLETAFQAMIDNPTWKIVQRTLLRGSEGKGISIHDYPSTLEPAPLYVRYIPKTQEYRVHVVKGKVIDVQRKARNSDIPDEDVNWQVRNHKNGFIFMREGVSPDSVPEKVIRNSLESMRLLGLDFGAVDIIWNQQHDKAYVLEVNTSPGMTGTTLDKYCEAFQAVHDNTEIGDWYE